jgi:hypothetical protein
MPLIWPPGLTWVLTFMVSLRDVINLRGLGAVDLRSLDLAFHFHGLATSMLRRDLESSAC